MPRNHGTADRFYNYMETTAKFDSTATCSHPVKRGDRIGYNPRAKTVRCTACWDRWVAENQEADYLERNPGACCW